MGAARPFPPALHIFAAPQGKDNDEKIGEKSQFVGNSPKLYTASRT